VPLDKWVRRDYADLLRARLIDKPTLAPWIRQERVQSMVDEHLSGRASHGNRLWSLLVLAQWIEGFKVPV
jgi:hypothetical protein